MSRCATRRGRHFGGVKGVCKLITGEDTALQHPSGALASVATNNSSALNQCF
ncbi:hypothetical protein BLL52_0007 [Rhodoferax antarcticus ANT.BR]|uniref:Uncharacterized protein n=1 Tax=Rhodoferax antarcticus ANT.BR TaxID=1111071 RepID=A0A1Q8YK24_9BURK|nr:hypothetical protein BLL52_0007 [Rhodoferax antarcticus ANT.BR]